MTRNKSLQNQILSLSFASMRHAMLGRRSDEMRNCMLQFEIAVEVEGVLLELYLW